MSSVWEFCDADEGELSIIRRVQENIQVFYSPPSSSGSISANVVAVPSTADNLDHKHFSHLIKAESTCKELINELGYIDQGLKELSIGYDEVSGRSDSLMRTCENILDKQSMIQNTIDSLKSTLAPFEKLEKLTGALGMVADERGQYSTLPKALASVDPRSNEFKEIVSHLTAAVTFLCEHSSFYDAEKYFKHLIAMHNRCTSVVVRNMKEMLLTAAQFCNTSNKGLRDKHTGNVHVANGGEKDVLGGYVAGVVLESSYIYYKFKGLGFRMRELSLLLTQLNANMVSLDGAHHYVDSRAVGLKKSASNSSIPSNGSNGSLWRLGLGLLASKASDSESHSNNSSAPSVDILTDIKDFYMELRIDLLKNILQGVLNVKADGEKRTVSVENTKSPDQSEDSLCFYIKFVFTTLLRITLLEDQLFGTLFGSIGAGSSSVLQEQEEVSYIVEMLCKMVEQNIRPLVISERAIEELCHVISTLQHDIYSQILAAGGYKDINQLSAVLTVLMTSLRRIVCESQERLIFLSEGEVRHKIQLFSPIESDLSYPDCLVQSYTASLQSASSTAQGKEVLDLFVKTWYPPLRTTLSILSKLYGVVDGKVFDDISRRSISYCVMSLRQAAEAIRKRQGVECSVTINGKAQSLCNYSGLHSNLFLIRNLLTLREQLVAFDIKHWDMTERTLDFSNTGHAISGILSNGRTLLRLDNSNALLQLATKGLPNMQEKTIDIKKELDDVLKNSYDDLKDEVNKLLVSPLDAFLIKVNAICSRGTDVDVFVPVKASGDGNHYVQFEKLSEDHVQSLRQQLFVKPDRVNAMVQSVVDLAIKNASAISLTLHVYISNEIARAILLKPIKEDISKSFGKMMTVLTSVFAGADLVTLEQLLGAAFESLTKELFQSLK